MRSTQTSDLLSVYPLLVGLSGCPCPSPCISLHLEHYVPSWFCVRSATVISPPSLSGPVAIDIVKSSQPAMCGTFVALRPPATGG